MTDDWKKKPTEIYDINKLHVKYVIGIDESGNLFGAKENLKKINKGKQLDEGDRFLTICAAIIEKSKISKIRKSFDKIKTNYWPNYKPQQVVFHNTEINGKRKKFNLSRENFTNFITELSYAIINADFSLSVIYVDLIKYYNDLMKNPNMVYDVYEWMISELTEQLIDHYIAEPFVLLIESRDKLQKNDNFALKTIMKKVTNNKKLRKLLKGVYFIKKNPDNSPKSYLPIEIADLCAGPHNVLLKNSAKNIKTNAKDCKLVIKKTNKYLFETEINTAAIICEANKTYNK